MTEESGSLEAFVATSPTLGASLASAPRAATSDASILILGEPGTGRTTLARALHRASLRRSGPLVELDPSTVPPTLLESELFGYRAGAFSGAENASVGRVEQADGGSLLLDHVEALPLASQPKLLRVLAERRFSPLGGEERGVDVRFLAIGADDLPRRAERDQFRKDLFYRLEVLSFHLPPLRFRPQDVERLSEHFLVDLATRLGRSVPRLHARARAWMTEYRWPGNVRELRNVLERAVILDDAEVLDPPPPSASREHRPATLAELERDHIRATLAYTRGHQGRAAEVLGISRKALWEKRKRFGLP